MICVHAKGVIVKDMTGVKEKRGCSKSHERMQVKEISRSHERNQRERGHCIGHER